MPTDEPLFSLPIETSFCTVTMPPLCVRTPVAWLWPICSLSLVLMVPPVIVIVPDAPSSLPMKMVFVAANEPPLRL